MTDSLTIAVLPELLSVCRLGADAPVPDWALNARPFCSITRTADELSLICPTSCVPIQPDDEQQMARNDGWRALKLLGPIAFTEVGVLLKVASPMRDAGISILPVATFDTDYVLVPGRELQRACDALRNAGHRISGLREDLTRTR